MKALTAENSAVKELVKSLTNGMSQLSDENMKIKETFLDLQSRSMRDNLVFMGKPETLEENAKEKFKGSSRPSLSFQRTKLSPSTFTGCTAWEQWDQGVAGQVPLWKSLCPIKRKLR